MTPKEKAEELVSNYQKDKIITYQRSAFSPIEEYELTDEEAKYCALICVDEMEKNLESLKTIYMSEYTKKINYLKEVKQEIKSL